MGAPFSAWITPQNMPSAYVRRVVLMPDDPEWIANFLGALLTLTEQENHERLDGVTIAQAASVWQYVFDEFLGGETCPEP